MATFNSTTFNVVKSVQESITNQYSSKQLIEMLDSCIYNAIERIVRHTDWMDIILASVLSWYSQNYRRKISPLSRQEFFLRVTIYLMIPSPRIKMKILKSLRIERNLLLNIISHFLEKAEEYSKLEVHALQPYVEQDWTYSQTCKQRMLQIEQSLTAKGGTLSVTYNYANFWFQQAIEIKNNIIEKYLRYAAVQANLYYRTNTDRYDLDDLLQNFIVAINKAVNKFDQRKGALTSYIEQWLKNAKSNSHFVYEYGLAYDIPRTQKQKLIGNVAPHKVNISESLTNYDSNFRPPVESEESDTEEYPLAHHIESPEDDIERESTELRIRELTKYADPRGFTRLRSGILEYLTKEELQILSLCTKG